MEAPAMNRRIICSALLALSASVAAPAGAASFLDATGPFNSFSCSGAGTVTCIDNTQSVSSNASGVLFDAGLFNFNAGAGNVLSSLEVLVNGTAAGSFAVGFHGFGSSGLGSLFTYGESTSSFSGVPSSWSFGPTSLFSGGSSEFASFSLFGSGLTTGKGLAENEIEFIANVSPVPEPTEWALMLVGAAMIGAIACRRQGPRGVALPA
jgi:PEP-CTERM motif-containing protein